MFVCLSVLFIICTMFFMIVIHMAFLQVSWTQKRRISFSWLHYADPENTHNPQMKSLACWYWLGINCWFQSKGPPYPCEPSRVYEPRLEPGLEFMAQSLETGKRQNVLLLLTLYPSVVFLIRNIALYCPETTQAASLTVFL